MENTLFSLLLFVLINVFTAWLIGDSSDNFNAEKLEPKTATTTPQQTPVLDTPIEQQCKDVFTEILTPDPLPDNVRLTEQDIDALGIREARKVIAELNKGLKRNDPMRIRLKVNGKDQPKSWLIRQIKTRIIEKPDAQNVIAVTNTDVA